MEYVPDNYDLFLAHEQREEEEKKEIRWRRLLEKEGRAFFEADEEGEVYDTI